MKTRPQKFFGTFQQQAATVTRFTVCGDGAAVGEAVQGGNGSVDQPTARLVVEIGDQAKPATVSLV
jgi:hypothetical protein